jgi:uncharacterized damage-inducible protein DinB
MSLTRLLDYDLWANRATIASVAAASQVPPRTSAVVAHIVAAEWLWWARVQDEPARLSVWPTLSVERCDAEMIEVGERWRSYVAGLDVRGLARAISYTNSKGEMFTSAVEDVVLHIVFHSTHHRGQIAAALRASGTEPAYTDYIHARRQGLVK